MGLLDNSTSERDSSLSSSCDDWEAAKKIKPTACSMVQGNVDDRLKAILQLKHELHIEEDPEYIAKEARKEAKKKEIKAETEKENRALEGMSIEEKLEVRRASVASMMDHIRRKRESSSKRNLLGDSGHRHRGVQRTFSSASGCSIASDMSVGTANSCMSEMELSEFEKLKAKKERRQKKRGSKKVKARR